MQYSRRQGWYSRWLFIQMVSRTHRAAQSVGLAKILPKSTRRHFHPSTQLLNGHGPKPTDDGESGGNGDTQTQSNVETTGGRLRTSTPSTGRSRQIRRSTPSALPPVKLPHSFLKNNVSTYSRSEQPKLSRVLEIDTKCPKISLLHPPIGSSKGSSKPKLNSLLETYFETAVDQFTKRSGELVMSLPNSSENEEWTDLHSSDIISRAVRVTDMFTDSAWHLADTLYPARQAEYSYTRFPFWWWHIYKDLDIESVKFRDQFAELSSILRKQALYNEFFDCPLSHAVADLPVDTFYTIQSATSRELYSTAPSSFDSRLSKRPVNILSISGYGGKAITETTADYVAHVIGADLIRLDAYDLALLVGDYLGQNLAFSRGPLSMLGFRAAQLNGKLSEESNHSARSIEDDEPDHESTFITARIPGFKSLEDDLRKIKDGGFDCFSKWEQLKIDKILDTVINCTDSSSQSAVSRPILIHINDIVELSMTLEGSALLSRLRSLVDAAWQAGKKIAILGTSSSENPSDEYIEGVHELSINNFVVSRHLQPNIKDAVGSPLTHTHAFDLQRIDFLQENMRNILSMVQTLEPEARLPPVELFLHPDYLSYAFLSESILPIPEVYHLARLVNNEAPKYFDGVRDVLLEYSSMGPLRQKSGQRLDEPDEDGTTLATGGASTLNVDSKSDNQPQLKLNEYEKRIISGQINKENLRVTFADVHAPVETIQSLKILTSLALVRPDAFSYGVLAADKIPGCLLYGPPGTGKTMLAKAVAKESGANMLEISGANVNDKWVGESEKLIRAVFTLAKKLSPCVVFIDEADSLLASRSMFSSRASHREHINQFLKEWDGMEETNAFIMVATNRPFDLDDAVLRRLPRKLLVDLPLRDDRLAIFKLLLRDETLDGSVHLEDYAERTTYYSGSDLKNVCVAAAMSAVEEENQAAEKHDGPEPFQYPQRRTLRHIHFENAMKQIPASISEDMTSLKQIRKFDEQYGNRRKGLKKSAMGFGLIDEKRSTDSNDARIRQHGTS